MAANSMILLESAAHQCFFLKTLCFEEVDYVLNTSLFVEKNVAIFSAVSVIFNLILIQCGGHLRTRRADIAQLDRKPTTQFSKSSVRMSQLNCLKMIRKIFELELDNADVAKPRSNIFCNILRQQEKWISLFLLSLEKKENERKKGTLKIV